MRRLACLLALVAAPALAETPPVDFLKKGPLDGDLGGIATLKVPEGCLFVEKRDMPQFLKLTGNLPDPSAIGALMSRGEEGGWVIFFDFDASGYVKDDEKDKLDADKILESLREGNEAANEARKEQGMPPMTLAGWHTPPFYDGQTHNLTWALRLSSGRGEVVNYNSRLLGRKGVTEAVLAVSPEHLEAALPDYKRILEGFAYAKGQGYAEFRSGDKVAAYGLAALVGGGAAVTAAKLGLFAKMGKFLAKFAKLIVIGVIGLSVMLKKRILGLFGKGEEPEKAA